MNIRTLSGAFCVLLSTFASGISAQPQTEGAYTLKDIYGGFLLNKEVAATLMLCKENDNEKCYYVTLNHSALLDVVSGIDITNIKDNNKNFVASSYLQNKSYTLSKDNDSALKIAVIEQSLDSLKIEVSAKLAASKKDTNDTVNYIQLSPNIITLPQKDLHHLKSLLGISLNGGENKYQELSDCDFASKLYDEVQPLMHTAGFIATFSVGPSTYYDWRKKTFKPKYKALRGIYDPINYQHNRTISRLVYDDYLVALGTLVSGLENKAKYDINSTYDIEATIKKAEKKYTSVCNSNKELTLSKFDDIY
ncbi:hypothetical protein ABT56_12505 [Photobacterium aquae]|uniref:Uncharacterized protein n=1 Tax=Photobacterium aquae TaxID=1195763 RepID=A0A0J1H043_9GAMM|nr:hypothetical protein [Photobacterium aquae]KLV05198.1 hypothetical protein ABT56_12505 [Photobacterium aquae]